MITQKNLIIGLVSSIALIFVLIKIYCSMNRVPISSEEDIFIFFVFGAAVWLATSLFYKKEPILEETAIEDLIPVLRERTKFIHEDRGYNDLID